MRANAARRCLAETDCDLKVKPRTNVLFGWAEVVFGEDECAAAQTVHFNASVTLEWWCATNATADQNVSKTQKTAMCLTIDRINARPRDQTLQRKREQTRSEYKPLQLLRPTKIRALW